MLGAGVERLAPDDQRVPSGVEVDDERRQLEDRRSLAARRLVTAGARALEAHGSKMAPVPGHSSAP